MTPKRFVAAVRQHAIKDNLAAYRDLFASRPADASDAHWKSALTLFSTLNPGQRKVLFAIIRQVQVDTVSTLLGIIDGAALPEDFVLTCDSKEISGDLQDLFLEAES